MISGDTAGEFRLILRLSLPPSCSGHTSLCSWPWSSLLDGTATLLHSTTENSRWVGLLLAPWHLTCKLIILSMSQWGARFFPTLRSSPHSVGGMVCSPPPPHIFSGCRSLDPAVPGKEEGSGKGAATKAMISLSVVVTMG